MDQSLTTLAEDLGPIQVDWTIAELISWLAEESHQHDPALQHPLAMIEAAVTGALWARTPSTVALIRSLTLAGRDYGSSVIADVLHPIPQAQVA